MNRAEATDLELSNILRMPVRPALHEDSPTPSEEFLRASISAQGSNNPMYSNNDLQVRPGAYSYGNSQAFHDQTELLQERALPSSKVLTKSPLLWWAKEVLAIIAAALILATLVFILLFYNDLEQPKWPHGINLSTVLAVLSTVLRVILMFVTTEVISHAKWTWFDNTHSLEHLETFDKASRSVLGSLGFLFWLRKPHWTLLPALVTVLSLAIGPITQQTLNTFPCPIKVPNIASSISVASYVEASDILFNGASLSTPVLDYELKFAIIRGLTGLSSATTTVNFDCPTGNCTFPSHPDGTYSSLGYCSTCSDTSSHIKEIKRNSSWGFYTTVEYSPDLSRNLSLTDKWMVSLASSGMRINYPARPFLLHLLAYTYHGCKANKLGGGGKPSYQCEATHSLPHLPRNSSLLAVTCSMAPCLRNYASSVSGSKLEEQLISTTPVNISGPLDRPYMALKSPCSVDGHLYDVSNFSSVPRVQGRESTWVIHGKQNSTAPLECVYSIERGVLEAIHEQMRRELNGTCGAYMGRSDVKDTIYCPDDIWLLKGLYNSGNATVESISAIMDNTAETITKHLRKVAKNAYRNGPGVVTGQTMQMSVCTRVTWIWMALPATLTAMTIVILTVVVAQTWRDRATRPVWKSSILPPVFHGLSHGYEAKDQTDLKFLDQMQKAAKQMNVRLGAGEVELAVVSVDEKGT